MVRFAAFFVLWAVAASLSALPTPPPHPRLLATNATFARVLDEVKSDPVLKGWYARLKADADALAKKPPYRYELRDGVRLLGVSRDVLHLVTTEALVYRLSGDPKYLNRAWAELDNVARFADWHPAHFLDVAEMAAAVSLGYDWLADALTADQKAELRRALVEKALEPALPFLERKTGWATMTNNWNFVCNGGVTLAALAVADEEPRWIERVLPRVLESLPRALGGYAPDGAWNESPSYWDYGKTYLVELISALQTSLGSDEGLLATPGLDRTGSFALALASPGRYFFGYGDVGSSHGVVSSPALWFLAQAYHQPAYAWARKVAVGDRPEALDLLWYRPEGTATPPDDADFPLDQSFRRVEVVTHRASWTDPGGLFVGFRGTAFPDRNHTDLDSGTFVLGVFGALWVTDLGSDNYNLPGYFTLDPRKADNRWNLYRKRAEGHNTLVINPGRGPDQDPAAGAPLDGDTVDLTKAYPGAVSVKRTLTVAADRTKVTVADAVHLKAPGDVWSFVHLEKDVVATVAEDGRSVVLARPKQAETVTVALVDGPADLRFTVADAVPLASSPPVNQNPNAGYHKLVLHAPALKDGDWALEFTFQE